MRLVPRVLMSIFAACALSASGLALAQSGPYPNKPIKFIVGFAPGGPADVIGRAIAQSLSAELGQQVVVDNRTGAAGVLGLDAVTTSAPDGYTVGLLANTTTTALHFTGKPLNVATRVTPVGRFVSTRILLVTNPTLVPAKTLPEFVEYARQHPGMNVTSAGHAGLGHLGLELLALEQKLDITHVPYRGSGPALNDVLAGLVPAMIIDASSALPHIQSDKLRAIAVVSTERLPAYPNLPTAVEQGFKSFQIDSSMGIVLPPNTPQPIVDRLRVALKKAVDSESYSSAARTAGNARFFEDAPAYGVWMEKDFARWGEVIKKANVKPS